ncbi:MAG: hypothetical protein ACKO0V_17215 [bacterium]
MNIKVKLIGLLICSVLAGCGSGSEAVTDPSKLKPLTDAEKAEIKKQDEAVRNEEGASYDAKKK